MSWALRDVARTVAYCDNDPVAQQVLAKNMQLGNLRNAPTCPDVSILTRAWLSNRGVRRCDLVTAGFPCTGFSTAGHREGFRDVHSHLFTEVTRVVDEVQPWIVFLENTPEITVNGMKFITDEMVRKRGFELRYCMLRASDVGAPHARKRWFCVAIKRGDTSALPQRAKLLRMLQPEFTWGREPNRTDCRMDVHESNSRHRLLGNSVVPDVARRAFATLLIGDHVVIAPARGHWPQNGIVNGTTSVIVTNTAWCPPVTPVSHAIVRHIVLDPRAFKSHRRPNVSLTSGRVRSPVKRSLWGTPARGCLGPGNFLTHRNVRKLHTQVRFERDTKNRECVLSARWVEWLMGVPRDWTRRQ